MSRGRGKWFVESEVGRAVKLGIQRMKIKSIGSDPRKHNNNKIKSKLLADDAPHASALAPAHDLGVGSALGGGGGGFNFNAFAAAVQSNSTGQVPEDNTPSSSMAGNGNNVFSNLMSALGNSAGGMPPMPAMPAMPAHAMREQDAFVSMNGSSVAQQHRPTPQQIPEPDPASVVLQEPPPILPFTSLYSVKVENSDSESYSYSESESEDAEPEPAKSAKSNHHTAAVPKVEKPLPKQPAPAATQPARAGLSPTLIKVGEALGETKGLVDTIQEAFPSLTNEEQSIMLAAHTMIKKVAWNIEERKKGRGFGLPEEL
ncbi:hypothetical protein A3770_09p55310 [Chloropicon primus]|uniref:Uncharacterized protein n=1 Tax=Chloropicon primus TaxID=1764295 RepID=A0A5B8MRE0_9CHLO|nr:hypothetical protein A3770_09p55310 [Chloropicon primus]|eukprot:QDZ23013.1 hypothetical protein A3770_09p55310 [Chloropicon primus]